MRKLFSKDKAQPALSTARPAIDEAAPPEPVPVSVPAVSAAPAAAAKKRNLFSSTKSTPAQQPSRAASYDELHISSAIGYLAARGQDDRKLLHLCDLISSSEAHAKEAAVALRKELQHGAPDAQARACRMLVVVFRNSSDRFRLQVVRGGGKFLDAVADVAKSKKTTFEVKEALLKAMSVLAYENQVRSWPVSCLKM